VRPPLLLPHLFCVAVAFIQHHKLPALPHALHCGGVVLPIRTVQRMYCCPHSPGGGRLAGEGGLGLGSSDLGCYGGGEVAGEVEGGGGDDLDLL